MGVIALTFEFLYTYPTVLFSVTVAILGSVIVVKLRGGRPKGPNPFASNAIRLAEPLVTDNAVRKAVLKQKFHRDKVPGELDAIVIGSGIGGLTVAAILAKVGKRVLVLEQHNIAGGCTHTYRNKGFEFDVGIHYVGEMGSGQANRFIVDQLTEGQLQWEPIVDDFDHVVIGDEDYRTYKIHGNYDRFIDGIISDFPGEEPAIREYAKLLRHKRMRISQAFALKMIPLWASRLLVALGLHHRLSAFFGAASQTVDNYLEALTSDPELRAVLAYNFGDYGVIPDEGSLGMHLSLNRHFLRNGVYFPVGGASQIAFAMIPVVERPGGAVLTGARVARVLMTPSGAAHGVEVRPKSGEAVQLFAPVIISAAGLPNTQRLLPSPLSLGPSTVGPGPGNAAISLFVGLSGSPSELNLPGRHYWVFQNNRLSESVREYLSLDAETAGRRKPPLAFVTFPSSKDPTWESRCPGRSVCTVVSLVNYEWFRSWETERHKRRGEEYEATKGAIGRRLWERVLDLFPRLEDKVVHMEVGSPLSNNHYIGSTAGEIYGLHHGGARFDPWTFAQLRPATRVPRLYLSGQDVSVCGFSGAMMGGLICASEVLGRDLTTDIKHLMAKSAK